MAGGLALTALGTVVMCFVMPARGAEAQAELPFPAALYAVWAARGFGMALVHNCSFPMVVELCPNSRIGRFTGYYYAASMSAQTLTPVLLGLVFKATLAWRALPVYAMVLYILSCSVFSGLVKNIRVTKPREGNWADSMDVV